MPTLNWIGKDKVINHHLDVPYRVLEKQYTYNSDTDSENKIIHGDNLEALKSLLPEYEGRIKCIYIDPPYNTGNEGWVYNDNVNDPKIKKWLGEVVGKESEDLTRHDKWLCMMYPRLKLLYRLLHKDGSLIISIGNHELNNLILICREIFSSKQIVTVTVQTSGGKPSAGFNIQNEYLVFIVPNNFSPNPLLYTGGKSRTPFEGLTLATFDKTQRPNQTYPIYVNIDDGSLYGVGVSLQEKIKNEEYTGNIEDYEYNFNEAPEGTVAIWPITSKGKECVWRLIPTRLKNDWDKGYIKISPNKMKDSLNKYSIQYLPEGVIKKIESGKLNSIQSINENIPTLSFGENKTVGSEIPTIWNEKEFYTVKGTELITQIFSEKKFNYPKSLELITEIFRAVSEGNDLILDSFAGSGTTAHAVLNLNKQDGGNRKFILIEMMEYADSLTAERVKRVINGYGEGNNIVEGIGGNFSYYELGQPVFLENEYLNEDLPLPQIHRYVWYTETNRPYNESVTEKTKYLLGINENTSYHFYYEKDRLTTLNYDFLKTITNKAELYIIYADNCSLSKEFLSKNNIIFKKIPRDISRF